MTTPPTGNTVESSDETPLAGPHETGRAPAADRPDPHWAVALRWGLAGLISAPVAIFPHEMGHYLVLLWAGAPDLALHFAAVTWDLQEFWEAIFREDFDSAAAVMPIWQVALSDATGPIVTYAIVAACCYGCARWRPHPSLVAVALASQLRIRAGANHMADRALGNDRAANYDELRVSMLTGIPVEVLVGFALLTLLVTTVWLLQFLPPGRRITAGAALAGGIAASVVLYFGVVGPWLLP